MDLVVNFHQFTLQKLIHEAVQLQTPFSLSFPPWIRKANLKMGENRKTVQESQQINSLLYTAFMKMSLFLMFLLMCHWGKLEGETGISPAMAVFLSSHSDKIKLLAHTMGVLVHCHATWLNAK